MPKAPSVVEGIDLPSGPNLSKLSPNQRVFVEELTRNPNTSLSLAYQKAFPNNHRSHVGGCQALARSPKVIAAIREIAEHTLKANAIKAAAAVIEIVDDIHHKDRYKAADRILNQAGLVAVTKHETTIKVETRTPEEILASLNSLMLALGMKQDLDLEVIAEEAEILSDTTGLEEYF